MARVVVELEKLRDVYCGLGQFALHLGNALLEETRAVGIEPVVLTRRGAEKHLKAPGEVMEASWWRRRTWRGLLRALPWKFDDGNAGLWHLTHHQSKFWPVDRSIPVLITLHDLKFIHLESPREVERELRRVQRTVDQACGVATGSHSAAGDIASTLDLKGKPLRVVYDGVYPRGSIGAREPAGFGGRPFLFSIGLFEPKKNFHSLVDMMEHLPEFELAFAGDHATPYGRQVAQRAASKPWGRRIRFLGKIPDGERQWLYEHCAAFVLPSLAEGFGLPVLEAMSAARPVVLAARASLPEVGGDEAAYWRDFEPQGMAAVVRSELARFAADSDAPRRLVARAAGFSWQETARRYAAWYQEILDAHAPGGRAKPSLHPSRRPAKEESSTAVRGA